MHANKQANAAIMYVVKDRETMSCPSMVLFDRIISLLYGFDQSIRRVSEEMFGQYLRAELLSPYDVAVTGDNHLS